MTSKPAGCKINVDDVAQRWYGLGPETHNGVTQMDAALTNPTGRKFPSMTTGELKIAVIDYQLGLNPNAEYMTAEQVADIIARMTAEVLRREAGFSKSPHEVLGG